MKRERELGPSNTLVGGRNRRSIGPLRALKLKEGGNSWEFPAAGVGLCERISKPREGCSTSRGGDELFPFFSLFLGERPTGYVRMADRRIDLLRAGSGEWEARRRRRVIKRLLHALREGLRRVNSALRAIDGMSSRGSDKDRGTALVEASEPNPEEESGRIKRQDREVLGARKGRWRTSPAAGVGGATRRPARRPTQG